MRSRTFITTHSGRRPSFTFDYEMKHGIEQEIKTRRLVKNKSGIPQYIHIKMACGCSLREEISA